MKHQYFGDVNDYRKYGLLRCITEATGLPLGVLWLLTRNDARNDGEFRTYLREPHRWSHHDPTLYQSLSRLLEPTIERHIDLAGSWDVIPGARYSSGLFTDDERSRAAAFTNATQELREVSFVFVDPDNGIEVPSVKYGATDSCKFVYWRELRTLYRNGHSLVVYQHYPRQNRDAYHHRLAGEARVRISAETVAVFATSHVAFFLILQPHHTQALGAITELVQSRWPSQIRLAHVAAA